mgnify:CR=1 FL=1
MLWVFFRGAKIRKILRKSRNPGRNQAGRVVWVCGRVVVSGILSWEAGREPEQGAAEGAAVIADFGTCYAGRGVVGKTHFHLFVVIGFVVVGYFEPCQPVAVMEIEAPPVQQQLDVAL